MNTAVVVRFSDFPQIAADRMFSHKLYHARRGNTFASDNCRWVGEVHALNSLPVFHYDGRVWSPRFEKIKEIKEPYSDQPPERFCLLSISGDLVSHILDQRDIGGKIVDSIQSFSRNPAYPVYAHGCGQCIEIVETFSSDDVGISVLEGNCSWLVGKEKTPTWARAMRQNHAYTRELLELILALKQAVKVNLSTKEIQDLAQYF